jgi:hypothetical protein
MPHFKLMKMSLENSPLRTTAPNVGAVDVPGSRKARPDSKNTNRVGLRRFSEECVLVLPGGKLVPIVLIGESMLRRSTATDGRLLRDRVLCGFCVRMNVWKQTVRIATRVMGKPFRMAYRNTPDGYNCSFA